MSLDKVIQIKKMMFLRTILIMDEGDVCKRLLNVRAHEYVENNAEGRINEFCSPIFDIINTSISLGLYDVTMRMINSGCYMSKYEWRNLVWEKAWEREEEDCVLMYKQPHQDYLLFRVSDMPYYLIWWALADLYPRKIRMCEIMAALVCDTGLLRANDLRLKKKSFSHKVCGRCDLGILENINHVVMQCPYFQDDRARMCEAIQQLGSDTARSVMEDIQNFFYVIMGKHPDGAPFQAMIEIWLITGDIISNMYRNVISDGRQIRISV